MRLGRLLGIGLGGLFVLASVASDDLEDGVLDASDAVTVEVAAGASAGAEFQLLSEDGSLRRGDVLVTLSTLCTVQDVPPSRIPALTFVTQALPATDGTQQKPLAFVDGDGVDVLALDPNVAGTFSATSSDEREIMLRCEDDVRCEHIYRAEVAREVDALDTVVSCTVSAVYSGTYTPRDGAWSFAATPSGT